MGSESDLFQHPHASSSCANTAVTLLAKALFCFHASQAFCPIQRKNRTRHASSLHVLGEENLYTIGSMKSLLLLVSHSKGFQTEQV